MPFRFKHFEVEDEQSTLRVSTDAMLLGAWAEPGPVKTILDIGTGCGVLALMMAQKSEANVEGIDIDKQSIDQARENFIKSKWSERLKVTHKSLFDLSVHAEKCYGFIITNPPFFSASMKSPSDRKNRARHEIDMTHSALLEGATKLMERDGRLALILPASMGPGFEMEAGRSGLFLSRSMLVSSREYHPPKRILLEFSFSSPISEKREDMFIQNKNCTFSDFYLHLTQEFHQF